MALMKAMCAYSAIPHSLNEYTFIVNGAASGSVIFTFYCSKKSVLRSHARGENKSDAGPDPSMTCSRVSPMQPQCSLEI